MWVLVLNCTCTSRLTLVMLEIKLKKFCGQLVLNLVFSFSEIAHEKRTLEKLDVQLRYLTNNK